MKDAIAETERVEQTWSEDRRAWSWRRLSYQCRDGVTVGVRRAARGGAEGVQVGLRNEIQYARDEESGQLVPKVCVSGTLFDRGMAEVSDGSEDARTMALPKTVRTVQQSAFFDVDSLRSVLLNEGLETLGSDEQGDSGVFEESGVREVRFPSTLVEIGCAVFRSCECLKSVMLPDGLRRIGTNAFWGSGLETVAFPPGLRSVGSGAFAACAKLCSAELNEGLEELGDNGDELSDEYGTFQESGIEEVTLPKTLREVGPYAFADCEDLSTISVEEGCAACLYREGVPEMTIVQSLSATLTGG